MNLAALPETLFVLVMCAVVAYWLFFVVLPASIPDARQDQDERSNHDA